MGAANGAAGALSGAGGGGTSDGAFAVAARKTLVRRAGLNAAKPLAELTDAELRAVCGLIRCCPIAVTGVMGMDNAQVTAGGVRTAQFRADTLESRIAPGVFACGEVLDIDGDCGGYNLQWAWSSGWLAGRLGADGSQEKPV